MYDLKPQLDTLLKSISGVTVYYLHPAQLTNPPVITYCEYSNVEKDRNGITESLSKIVIQIDIYAATATSLSSMAMSVDSIVYSIGMKRSYIREVYDTQNNLFHKTMFYKGFIDPASGVVYQIKEEH